tara:strand:+ start:42 stop:377 length:336 start_codon:yes stop_codon:yes gene_type:complete
MGWQDILKENQLDKILRRVNNFKTLHKDSTPFQYFQDAMWVYNWYYDSIDLRSHHKWEELGEEKPQINKDIEAKLDEIMKDPRIDEYGSDLPKKDGGGVPHQAEWRSEAGY